MKTVNVVLTIRYEESFYDNPLEWNWDALIDTDNQAITLVEVSKLEGELENA